MATWPESVHILVPSYRSANLLSKFLPDLLRFVPVSQVLVVDDASEDNTPDICSGFGITCLKHEINRGKGAALRTGFKYLLEKGTSWIITMDADGQHSPEDLHCFLDTIKETPDVGICIGSRTMKPGIMPFWRICSNRLTSWSLSLITGARILDSQCGYRIYSSALLRSISIEYDRFEMETEVIIKSIRKGYRVSFTKVQTLYLNDLSHISHLNDTLRWVKAVLITSFKSKSRK